jgi:environmental stress-induced protein Ves
MKILRYSELAVIPWKNGAGVRRDLFSGEYLAPQGSNIENSTWMISLADLNQDAPFSSYPGLSRWFMPIGNGRLTLLFKFVGVNRPVELSGASDAHVFSGDDELTMVLHDGPMKALNVMATGRRPVVSIERWHCNKDGLFFNEEEVKREALNFLLIENGACRVSTLTESYCLGALDSFTYTSKESVTINTDAEDGINVVHVCLSYS